MVLLLLTGRYYEAEICAFLLLLRYNNGLQGIVKNIVYYDIFLIQMMLTLSAALMGAPLSLELISTRELDIRSHHFSLSKVCIGSQCVQSWACLTAPLSCKQKQKT